MDIKKILLPLVLLIGFSATVSAGGLWDRSHEVDSYVPHGECLPPVKTDIIKPCFHGAIKSNDPLRFMKELTGRENIIRVNGATDLARIRDLLRLAESGEADAAGRRYFAYSPSLLRKAPVSMSDRRLDREIFMAAAARELRQVYTVDIAVNIKGHDGEIVYSFSPGVIELTSDVHITSRRRETMITYVADIGDGEYGYGIFYLYSGMLTNVDSNFLRVMSKINDNDWNAAFSALLEKRLQD